MAACFLAVFWIGSHLYRGRIDPSGMVANVGGRQFPAPSVPGRWRTVTVAEGPADAGASVRLPAIERDNIDPRWLGSLPPAMPEEVLRAFNRTGHQVEQHRELVPVSLQDGRQFVVPVDQVEIHYAGNRTY
jgi:hypothetical protein